ncbi:uncharacterized protein DS421_18g616140 [Arachis hypogaea]|nr:uncharacterized protein DS421_18g616140 [Arachis hypogaea]
MEDSMQSYLFFAVTKGTQTCVYTSWEDTRDQVCNYPFLEFHGFNSYQQAVLAFNTRLQCIAARTAAMLEMIGSSGEGSGVWKGSTPSRSSWPRPVVSWLPIILEEELNGEFAIVNSMEDWLVKVCHESDIPGPCFFKQERYVRDKGSFFGFTAVVPGERMRSNTVLRVGFLCTTILRAKVGQLEDAYEKLLASYEVVVNARIEGQSP